MPRKRLIVRGKVQGVGFRHFARLEVAKHGITGFVRNRIDGCVLIEVQGDKASLEGFIAAMHIGPSHAEVGSVSVSEIEEKSNEAGFTVTF